MAAAETGAAKRLDHPKLKWATTYLG